MVSTKDLEQNSSWDLRNNLIYICEDININASPTHANQIEALKPRSVPYTTIQVSQFTNTKPRKPLRSARLAFVPDSFRRRHDASVSGMQIGNERIIRGKAGDASM